MIDFDAVYNRGHRAGGARGGDGGDPRRPGADRRHHPQADVRAPDALRLRRRRHDRRQPQRLLRARHPPRAPAAVDGADLRRGDDAALRPRHAARHALPDGRRGQPHRRRRRCAADRRAAQDRARGRPRRQPAVPARRRHAAARDRPRQDRHFSRPGGDRARVQGGAGRGAEEGRRRGARRGGRPAARRPAERRGRDHRRPDAVVPRRGHEGGLRGDDRAPCPHAARIAAGADGARAARLRAQPRRASAPRRRRCCPR